MKKNILAVTTFVCYFLFTTPCLVAQNSINPDSINDSFSNMNDSFTSFQNSITTDFYNYKENQQKQFNDFKKAIQEKWGQNNFSYSDSVNWVEYSYDINKRTIVNFKEGTAKVELLVDPANADNEQAIEEDVINAIKNLSITKGKKNDIDKSFEEENVLSENPILENQLKTRQGAIVTKNNINAFAKEVIKNEKIKKEIISGDDNESRVIVSISIPLAPDYLKVRAEKLLPIINKYSSKYNIEPELILSVIHIESYFNPKAISHANAVGLMQLVPSSGGYDSYNYVFGKNTEPTKQFLYNPDNNINLGTAYLKILMTRYFNNINNNESKRYCVIGSYNTGVGNVCRTVSNNTIVRHTVNKINTMTPAQTYKFLSQNLSYKEARDYIVKVNDKYLMYKKLLSHD